MEETFFWISMTGFNEYLLKLVCLGSPITQKTEVIRQFTEGKFETNYIPTLGVDISTKKIQVNKHLIKLVFVDTAGEEFFGKLRPSYYRGASGALIFFEHRNRKTFEGQKNTHLNRSEEKSPKNWVKRLFDFFRPINRLLLKKQRKKTEKRKKPVIKTNTQLDNPSTVVEQYYLEFQHHIPDPSVPIGLVGILNGPKTFQVSYQEAQSLANHLGIKYFTVHPKNPEEMVEICIELCRIALGISQ
jgi:GTPase SAR1 family protein